MPNHTPIPYRVESHGTTAGNTTIEVHGADGVVAVVSYWGGGLHGLPNDIRQANAEFICRACNNHDALVEALQGLMDAYAPRRNDFAWQHLHSSVRQAMQALAAAKEAP